VIEKDRSIVVNKTYLMKMLPSSYQTHLQSQLSRAEYLLLSILDLFQIKFIKLSEHIHSYTAQQSDYGSVAKNLRNAISSVKLYVLQHHQ
jgi:hypothetical protein